MPCPLELFNIIIFIIHIKKPTCAEVKMFHKDLTVVGYQRAKQKCPKFSFLSSHFQNYYLFQWLGKHYVSFIKEPSEVGNVQAYWLISWHPVCYRELTRLPNQTVHLKKILLYNNSLAPRPVTMLLYSSSLTFVTSLAFYWFLRPIVIHTHDLESCTWISVWPSQ